MGFAKGAITFSLSLAGSLLTQPLKVTCWTKPIPEAVEYRNQNPCKLTGDFDGDGRPDTAEQVVEAGGKQRRGVQVSFASRRTSVLGAGVEIGNGGDDFSWMDAWRVMPGKEWKDIWTERPLPSGDVLLVESWGNASGLIGWVKGRPRWVQGDD